MPCPCNALPCSPRHAMLCHAMPCTSSQFPVRGKIVVQQTSVCRRSSGRGDKGTNAWGWRVALGTSTTQARLASACAVDTLPHGSWAQLSCTSHAGNWAVSCTTPLSPVRQPAAAARILTFTLPDLTLPYLPYLVYILTSPRVDTPIPAESQLGEKNPMLETGPPFCAFRSGVSDTPKRLARHPRVMLDRLTRQSTTCPFLFRLLLPFLCESTRLRGNSPFPTTRDRRWGAAPGQTHIHIHNPMCLPICAYIEMYLFYSTCP